MGHDQKDYWPGKSAVDYDRQPAPGVYSAAQTVTPLATWGSTLDRFSAIKSRFWETMGNLSVSAARLDGDFDMAPPGPPGRPEPKCIPDIFDAHLDDLTRAIDYLDELVGRIGRRM